MPHVRPLLAAGLALAAMAAIPASAQQVFRIVGPDGRITFTDQRPLDPGTKATSAAVAGADSTGSVALPFELRQVVSRYPVTVYTAPNCAPCSAGRSMLTGRGVPFTEKSVSTNDDIEALQRLSGATSLPFVTIGGQQIKGYSETEWTQFLDAAGYPSSSQLPASYRYAPATPLVAAQDPTRPTTPASAAETARAAAAAQRPATPPPPNVPPVENPAGIRF
ncbi:MAG TPA: glutaredoxin family protein [Ramlibacter sp.]|nr:glutaredoxin family protein [Ramlibacter sp.]